MIKTLEEKIFEKLKNIDEIAEVFDYYETNFSQFPYAGFELVEAKGSKLDTCNNIRTFSFGILIFQETGVAGRQKAKEILYEIAEKIIKIFDSDETFGDLAFSSEVVNIVLNDGMDDNKGKGLYLAITLNINTLLCLVK